MSLNLARLLLTLTRYSLRPISGTIISSFKSRSSGSNSAGFRVFAHFGQFCHRGEIRLNRLMIGKQGLGDIKELPQPAAFSKGVEWFTEIFFFYFFTFGIVFFEMRKVFRATNERERRFQEMWEKDVEFNKKPQMVTWN